MGIKVEGKNGVYAELVQHSCDKNNPDSDLLTVSVKYGLMVHAEALRHRQLSRGVKSNRAIPMKNIRSEVINDPYVPVWFGAAQRGMVADSEMKWKWLGKQAWLKSRYLMCGVHWLVEKLGAHKEWANRLLNPWQFVRETITATEWDNLYNLRLHKDAQKDIQEVVRCINEVYKKSVPLPIVHTEWHTPYVRRERGADGVLRYFDNNGAELSSTEASQCSAARCARSSYDNHDGTTATLVKDLVLWDQLVESKPMHSSPVEQQGTPMSQPYNDWHTDGSKGWIDGVTHVDKAGSWWSGNFKGWIQHRQLLPNHTCNHYEDSEQQ